MYWDRKTSTSGRDKKAADEARAEGRRRSGLAGCGDGNRCGGALYGDGYQCDEFPFKSFAPVQMDAQKPIVRCVPKGQNNGKSDHNLFRLRMRFGTDSAHYRARPGAQAVLQLAGYLGAGWTPQNRELVQPRIPGLLRYLVLRGRINS
jgi:hypothetical protein